MNKQLQPCPLCGKDIGVQITTAENCNGKVYRGICWGDVCKIRLPTEWYEKREDAVKAWNSLKPNEIAPIYYDNKKIPDDLLQKSVDEIMGAITGDNKFNEN